MHMRTHCKTIQNHRSNRSTREDRRRTDQLNGSSNSRRCRWCGGSSLYRRSECLARDSYCNTCHIKGHFEKVYRQLDSTRRINKRQPLHKLEDDEEDDDDDVTSVYSFKPCTRKGDRK